MDARKDLTGRPGSARDPINDNSTMPSWDPNQYLQFAEARTRPCRDLAVRVSVQSAKRIIDLGSGPGNSTEILASFWPKAKITALDNSAGMLEAGRRKYPNYRWIGQDIATWASTEQEQFDIVFSNAAMQWVPDHSVLFPQLLRRVASGVLAVQMPFDLNAPAHRIM